MKKGQIVEGFVTKVEFPNKGIALVEGEDKCVVVKNAIPGQKLRIAVNKIRKGKAEGRICLWRSPHQWKYRPPVRILAAAEAVPIRIFLMSSSYR